MGFHQYDFFAEALFGSGFKGIFDRVFGDSVSVRLALISKDDTSRGEETDNVFFSKPYKFASNEIYSRWLHGEHLRLSLNNKLVLAIAENNLDSAQTYLAQGLDVNAKSDSTNLFYVAAAVPALHMAKSARAVRLLLEKGVDVNAVDTQGNSALHVATYLDNYALAEILVRNKARLETRNHAGRAAIHEALARGNEQLVKLLITNGCDVNLADDEGSTPLHYCELFLCQKSAKRLDYLEIAKALLMASANTRLKDATYRTPLEWA